MIRQDTRIRKSWRRLPFLLSILLAAPLTAAQEEGEAYFEREVRPLLVTRCVSCHGPDRQEGEVRLDSREAILQPARPAPLAHPGKPEASRLVAVIEGRSTAPAACVLEPNFRTSLIRWIEIGLPWPNGTTLSAEAKLEASQAHWAFQPVIQTPPPQSAGNPIDAFITASLNQNGLTSSPEADRRTLIRRVSYTLTGLPPSAEDVERFVRDPDPAAYERLVDRLLDSPAYGEQWARHWLDVARYSDTKGYVYAREERFWAHAWAYRDWVVRALNEDVPYDRFLLLQLAADQVEDRDRADLAAMGFLTIGRRFLGVKHDIIDDRIDVVTRGAMGLTVGCARCHDHKYDPIPAADYYALYGVFDSSIEKLVPLESPGGDDAFWKGYREAVEKLNSTTAKRRQETAERVRSRIADYLRAQTELDKYPDENFGQIVEKSDLIAAFVRKWEAYLAEAAERRDPVFVPWHAFARLDSSTFAQEAAKVTAQLAKANPGEIHPAVAAFQTAPASFEEVIQRYGEVFKSADQDEVLRAVLHGPSSPCEVPDEPIVHNEVYFDSGAITELYKLQGDVERHIIKAAQEAPFALILEDLPVPVEPRILLRGNPLQKGETVPRRFLGFLAGDGAQPFQHGSGRLELARAIIEGANPLTARVMVNRVWTHHFGQGLVATPSDFGVRAAPPSHPELLDWLAATFQADGWSLKKLHRRILLSAAFRQSSLGPSDPASLARALEIDPGNRLLWRMNQQRLSYEALRDSMLAATGQLDRRLGGKPVNLFRAPYPNRRTLYGLVDRQFLPGTLRVFDFANPDLHIAERNETNVPQQALFFLNDPMVLDRAKVLAAGLEAEAAPETRVTTLFRSVFQRDPSTVEIAEALELVQAAGHIHREAPRPQVSHWQYGYGAVDEAAGRVSGFAPLPHFTGEAWQGGPAWPDGKLGWVQLTATGGHPGNDRQHAAVRRWTAPRPMTVSVQSNLIHEPSPGDGIRAFVISSRAGILKQAAVHQKQEPLNVASLTVQAGETLDFVVDIGKVLNSDQFLWSVTIQETSTEGNIQPWDSQADFPKNKAQPLTAWEQLAHTLLCSNEFYYVD